MCLSKLVQGMLYFTLLPSTVSASTPPIFPTFNLATTDECCKMTVSLNMTAIKLNVLDAQIDGTGCYKVQVTFHC